MENNWSQSYSLRKAKDKIFLAAVSLAALFAVLPLIALLLFVVFKGAGSLNWQFFVNLPRPVGEAGGGMANAIVGTMAIVGLASMFSLPIGIFGGLWLAEWGKGKRGFFIRYAVDVMSGFPTIIFGIFSYMLLVLTLKRFSALAGGFALGLIMIPYITKTTEEMIKMVPRTLKESALALGVPEWKVMLSVVLRTAWNGIFTGVMLAVARAAGETAPLLFTAFNNNYWNFRLDQPTASMTVQIYNYAISPFSEWNNLAWAGSMVLVGLILFVTVTVRKYSKRINYG
ncbi:phosphate ABC transporter, permease protein PstA [candidate division WOR-1 bacterium RIFOXYB2_FULL_48_7]|uniref:Phosphate transport system permease protein PstA n=1 Tax=candidate division WOR-1 bacterium RIFOXYB2_FULL_48_7 TaxID=1802583 RepID=A0A1F4TAA9_UNCSA|nr:MAG: phosphate ABC transporter, permease protein PstA [candidate division WOR-1 bacterium RIFOXYB2_FULL_48_7]